MGFWRQSFTKTWCVTKTNRRCEGIKTCPEDTALVNHGYGWMMMDVIAWLLARWFTTEESRIQSNCLWIWGFIIVNRQSQAPINQTDRGYPYKYPAKNVEHPDTSRFFLGGEVFRQPLQKWSWIISPVFWGQWSSMIEITGHLFLSMGLGKMPPPKKGDHPIYPMCFGKKPRCISRQHIQKLGFSRACTTSDSH